MCACVCMRVCSLFTLAPVWRELPGQKGLRWKRHSGGREKKRESATGLVTWWREEEGEKKKSWGLTVLSRGEFALVYKCVCACVIHYSD